jgi:NAD-dependent dihydropyrimidine dehydrogenase PreA subunit
MSDDGWMPIIHQDRCVGCGTCVQQCPTQALARVNDKAQLMYPERCIYCADCEMLCPEGAIEVFFVICPTPKGDPS